MFLNIDLVEHHVFLLGVDVRLHLHRDVPGQHREQQPLLENSEQERSNVEKAASSTTGHRGGAASASHCTAADAFDGSLLIVEQPQNGNVVFAALVLNPFSLLLSFSFF